MKKRSLHLLGILGLAFLTGACTRFEVRRDVQDSIKANESARSLAEWEFSPAHPHQLVVKWLTNRVSPTDVCAALVEQSDQDLSIFEDHLHEGAMAHLTSPCRDEIKGRLEDFWEKSRLSRPEDLNFRFNGDIVHTRDLSNGYYAVTGDLPQKQVLLTFDDGPHPEMTDRILRTLQRVNAKAVFFTKGQAVRAYPEVLRRIAQAGHSIGTHSVSHRCLPFSRTCEINNGRRLSHAEATAEIAGGHQAVYDVLGWVDPFFRFPYGESSPELKKYLRDNQVGEFYWSADSNDWRNISPETIVADTMRQVNARGRGILLFHDIHRRTAEAIPELLKELYFAGYTPVLMRGSEPNVRVNSRLVNRRAQ